MNAITQLIRDEARRVVAGLRAAHDISTKLAALGIVKEVNRYNYSHLSVDVKKEQLPALRRVFGKMKVQSKYPVHNDARKRDIVVNLTVDNYPALRFEYQTKLQRGAKCKIVKTVYKSTSLVCSI